MTVGLSCSISVFFFITQKTEYEMRISDWSSDVCPSYRAPASIRLKYRRPGYRPAFPEGPEHDSRRYQGCADHRHERRRQGEHRGAAPAPVGDQEPRYRGTHAGPGADRERGVEGKRVLGRVELGGRRIMKRKINRTVLRIAIDIKT